MARYGTAEYTLGPGPLSQSIKTLIALNVGAFVLALIVPAMVERLGLVPASVLGDLALWQPLTYMFLHGGIGHLLFNMLALWMFGTDLERTWGTRFFLRYYFVTGIGAALVTVLWSLTPLPYARALYDTVVIGASGAIYGLLLAYGLHFPHRTVFLYIFPVPARYAVLILGAIAFLSSMGSGDGVAHIAHLGGLLVGYVYLKIRRGPLDEIRYRVTKWRLGKTRSKFDVYPGGRGPTSAPGASDWTKEWKKHIH